MKNSSSRLVLGFFPAETGHPEDASRAAAAAGARVCLFRTGARAASHDFCIRYGALRMPGETLVVAQTHPDKIHDIVQKIRSAGSPSVFVLHTGPRSAPSNTGPSRQRLLTKLSQDEQDFHSACADLEEALRLHHSLTPAAEWLLDNSYLVLTHSAEIRRHLPKHLSKIAARIDGDSRLYQLAKGLVERTDGAITEAAIIECLRADHGSSTFTMSELWLFPLMLRLAIIERLAVLATAAGRSQQLRETACLWANRLAASARRDPRALEQMLARLNQEPAASNPYFALSLTEQLHDEESALGPAQRWIESKLNTPISAILQQEHTREAAQRVSTANSFGSLRVLSRLEFSDIFEQVSEVDAELRRDPGGIYPRSDFDTRDECRHVVEQVARYSGMSEPDVARRAIALASRNPGEHVAAYLLSAGLAELERETGTRVPPRNRLIRAVRRHSTPVYITAVSILTASFTALAVVLAWDGGARRPGVLAALGLLALFPLSELAIQIVNALVVSLLPPSKLPKMDFRDQIPDDQATLVVVPMMLTNHDAVRKEVEKLEVRFLANQEANLWFGLLADFTDSPDPVERDDEAILNVARQGIEDLNKRYPGGRFVLFHRSRVWSESEQRWIGRERKRGKIEELNAFLCNEGNPDLLVVGCLPAPIRYVLTLDSDTQLPPGAARRLIETMAHPLNRVAIDPVTRVRRRGYSIIQPRVSIALPHANATRFTRVFADTAGTDPYSKAISDAHQDLFNEAIFHGKAIYEVSSFYRALKDRFPAETLLSHDLIEGAHAGVAHASDIELFETIPQNYSTFSKREHRWIRGDWQIAAWAFGRVPCPGGRQRNPLSVLNRWRILDNLRRSLVPIASLLLLVSGWLASATPGVWSLVIALAVAIPAIAPLLDRWAHTLQRAVQSWQGAADQLVRAIIVLAFLPHQAWLSCDAIVRALYRKKTRRNLLEWEPADAVGIHAHRHMNAMFRQMLLIAAASFVLLLILAANGAFLPSFFFVALWITSPLLMLWLARPSHFGRARIEPGDAIFLRSHARRTWRFFDDLVNPQNNWLPPDNSQLALRVEVAQRTSPTNIGMWLTSALAARDFGYLTPDDLLERCSNTIQTLDRLDRHEGHWLNWYDTRTLDPLNPRYVSTVDSGNLLASFWVLEQGCRDIVSAPVIGPACMRGLSDTLSILNEICGRDLSVSSPLAELRRLFHGAVNAHEVIERLRLASSPLEIILAKLTPGDERHYWASRLAREVDAWRKITDRYLPWIETLTLKSFTGRAASFRDNILRTTPSLAELSSDQFPLLDQFLAEVGSNEWTDQIRSEYSAARANAAAVVEQFDRLAKTCSRFANEINMRFLYDSKRRLFGVGYAIGNPVEFNSHYDLLASECRLASLVAIAKGDVPQVHWISLGRPRASAGAPILFSWTGTMFEYLMPLLFMRSFRGSLLDRACSDAVDLQIEHGRRENLPWGVSECAYSAIDANQVYQYRAFGVPSLALKRGMEESAVVAPYATMLALAVNPAAAIQNIRCLEQLGLAGPMGLYESIDFSRESKQGQPGVAIYTYMAHHQGMSLVAIGNALHRGAMQRRFHSQLRIRAFESLLFERIPIHRAKLEEIEPRHVPIYKPVEEEPPERIWKELTAVPCVHLNGNGRYTLALTNAGSGFSRWNGFDVTRWRSDPALDPWGSFIYIRDLDSGALWSAANRPLGGDWGTSSVTFCADHADFFRRVSGIETRMKVTVAPEDDVEIRRLIVTNRSTRRREVEFTSYIELSLIPHRADTAHPAFAKMFVETERYADGVLIAHRRQRSLEDPQIWAAHVLLGDAGAVEFETDRAQFLGRGNTPANPAALTRDLTGSAGAVLDPIFSLRCRLSLAVRDRRELAFLTIVASSREELLAAIEKYSRPAAVARAVEMAWTRSQLELRYLGIRPSSVHRFHHLAGQLLYPNAQLRASSRRIARNQLGQSALWTYGISGDLPMLSVTVADARDIGQVRELLLAHAYCRLLGFHFDLIVLNQEAPSYDRPLREQLMRYIEAHSSECIDCSGGVFLRDWSAMPEVHRDLILASSSIVLHASRGSIEQQLAVTAEKTPPALFAPWSAPPHEPDLPLDSVHASFFNGFGGFTADEYVITLKAGQKTPAPWANVIANPSFGAMVTESGLGFTWSLNSQSNRLTPWHNDPVSDPQSEIIYVRDEDSGAVLTPNEHRVRHGQGYSVFEQNRQGIAQSLTVFVPGEDSVKVCRLELRNISSRPRSLTATYFAELVLGSVREDQQLHVRTDFDQGLLTAVQYWAGPATGQLAFVASDPPPSSWSGDRAAFLGRTGSRAKPAALDRIELDNRTGAGLDPAAALQVRINLAPGERKQVTFFLGQAPSAAAAREIIERASAAVPGKSWEERLGCLQVRTPLLAVDLLLNRWLLYQVLSCRFWGRSALYQSSGAFGFRDQLQDSLAFVYAAPHLTREHILKSAARQFVEGDVQHWWHADTGLGVRTRCSDDLVWLPFAAAHYVAVTGDSQILDEQIPFLAAPPLAESELERMFVPQLSDESASLLEHCRRALNHAWRLGPHNLPLIGSGDWNDGLNRVGVEGRGESVWLAWFLCAACNAFANIDPSGPWRQRAAELAASVERTSWDGQWYLRGFFDDGSPLGSHANEEARIDSMAQSWAVICGAADPQRMNIAMDSADRLLVNEEARVVNLFTPPFDRSKPHPGYIMGYPPGIRENGGQYTHGSLWLAMARARMRDGDRAVELLRMMNPIEHTSDPESAARFRGEPYISAADVYSAPGKIGRAGWTWYTGSAAWMYRIWIEEVLGFHLRGRMLTIDPSIPNDWPGFEITYRYRSATYEIRVEKRDDAPPPAPIELQDDGQVHRVLVIVPSLSRRKFERAETVAVPVERS